VLLFVMGLTRMGSLIRYIPGGDRHRLHQRLAVLIALSQVRELLGLKIDSMPADFVGAAARHRRRDRHVNPLAFGLGRGLPDRDRGLALGRAPRAVAPPAHAQAPGLDAGGSRSLATAAAASTLDLTVDTIGSRLPGGNPERAATVAGCPTCPAGRTARHI
jgi:SulP family sulfate permease